MPTTPLKNALYRLALPVFAPSPRGRMAQNAAGRPLLHLNGYERLLCRHHVLGASLLLRDGDAETRVYTSLPDKPCGDSTLFRVASITKMATALVALSLAEDGVFDLDSPVSALLPPPAEPRLSGVTLRHLLSHLSGLRDIPAADGALRTGGSWREVLNTPGAVGSRPGEQFSYCNFGFGLVGCAMSYMTGLPLDALFREKLFDPLGMRAALDATGLPEDEIMPVERVLPYRRGQAVTIPPLGRQPLTEPDPERHFGHTAGSLYTDAPSLSRMLRLIAEEGTIDGHRLLQTRTLREMTRVHGHYGRVSPSLSYGLGLLIISDTRLSDGRILGHQGYAYGCADGCFLEEATGRQVIFLNGGCSEARDGRLGLANRDVLRWALREEMPSWK